MNGIIITLIICITLIIITKEDKKKITASISGILLTKADRINSRIAEFEKYCLSLNQNKESISREDFKDIIRSIHLIVTTELNEKGVERKWKA